jgi:hypothetical protein
MADELKTETPTTVVPAEVRPEDIQVHNAAIKEKLESQDSAGHSNAPGGDGIFERTGSALDSLRDAVVKDKEEAAGGVEPAPEVIPKPDAVPEVKSAEALAIGEDPFKDIHLPPGARPKSGEAFGQIKARATQEIAAREKQIEELKLAVLERDEKLKNPVPPELDAEVKELREFRAKFDIEADPKFKDFDKRAEASREFIYSKLSENPNLGKDVVDAIKKHGGPENVQMEKIFAAMADPSAERLISARLAEIEMEKFNKQQAQALAKKNVSQYVADRQKAFELNVTAHNSTTKQELTGMLKNFEWMKPVTPAKDATAEQKTDAEAANKWIADTNGQLEAALTDDSPQMRAILLAGMARMFYIENKYTATQAQLVKAHAELKTLNEKLVKFKGASIARLDESSAAAGPAPVKSEEKDIFSMRASDSLDAIRARVIAERQRAAQ